MCPSGKTEFPDRQLALEALIQNHIRFNHPGRRGPRNVYQCGECGNFHFTSREPSAPELIDEETQRRIRRERVALAWEQKWRQ